MTSLRASVTASLFTLTACLGAVACSGFDGGGGAGGGLIGSSSASSSSASSSSSSSSSGGAVVSLKKEVEPIFLRSCNYGDCHSATSRKEGLDLSAGHAFDSLVNVESIECDVTRQRVVPGQPDKSYIIDKLKGQKLCFGVRMPLGDAALPAADLKKITDWIAGGALDN